MSRARAALLCRILAIAIAVMGVVDPALTLSSRTNVTVAVVTDAHGVDPVVALGSRVADVLARTFTVVRGPLASADAMVFVGRDMPAVVPGAAPVFVVSPDASVPRVDIEAINAPAVASVDGRVQLTATVRAVGAAGRTDHVVLRAGGVVVDRVEHAWRTADERAGIAVAFLPVVTGIVPLRVSVEQGSATDTIAEADTALEIISRPWRVLAYDARPSWASTFVRRATEDDRRFRVVTRTVTSRGVATETGQAVPALTDRAKLEDFDVVLIGAPDALSAGEVSALETFARERGGTVVLVPDRAELGAAARLARIDQWVPRQGSAAVSLEGAAVVPGRWSASELSLPGLLPPASETLAVAHLPSGDRPIVWQSPLGLGRVIVSGALDAWRYRADPSNVFVSFWQGALARAAALAPPPLDVRVSRSTVPPGGAIDARITRRAPTSTETTLRAVVERSDGTNMDDARVWPSTITGESTATIRAPSAVGPYRLVVTESSPGSADIHGEAAFVVTDIDHARAVTPDRSGLAAAWARAHRGSGLAASRMDSLPTAINAAIHRQAADVPAHPMRSGWWILPFALALGVEWWFRRVSGRA